MSMIQKKKVTLSLPEYETAVKEGTVIAVSSNTAIVKFGGEKVKAKKAFSCIIEPEPGDSVVCCRNEDGNFYILGIMERTKTEKINLSFPSDTTIASQKGSINIVSNDTVSIASENLNFFSRKTAHKSDQATIFFKDITAVGNTFMASYKTVSLISNLINTMAKQVIDKFKGYIRHTEDNDQVKAGQITRRAKGLYSMDSKHTIMVSRESTKIDGEKILMG